MLFSCSASYRATTSKPLFRRFLGAGNGALCRELAAAGYEVVGVEPDTAGVTIARQNCPVVQFYQLGVEDAPDSVLEDYPEGFDLVVSTEVIEHLYAPNQLISFAHSVLRQNGHLVITTPYHGYLKNLMLSLFNRWDRHADPLRNGGHIKFLAEKRYRACSKREGSAYAGSRGAGRLPMLWKSMIVVAVKK